MRGVNASRWARLAVMGLVAGTVTVAAVSAAAPADAATAGGAFVSLAPVRLLDTASGNGAPLAKVAGGHQVAVQITGRGGVPSSGVAAVAMAITSTASTVAGTITAYPDGSAQPAYSNLGFVAGKAITKSAVTKVGTAGKIDFFVTSAGATNISADVSGYFTTGTATAPGAYVPVTPSRILDTRTGTGASKAAIAAGHTLAVTVRGAGGIPANAGTAWLKLTATQATAALTVTAFADATTPPAYSNLSVAVGGTATDLVAIPLSAAGRIDLAVVGTGSTQLVAETVGYSIAGPAAAAGTLVPVAPVRILDTRTGLGAPAAAVTAGHLVSPTLAGLGGVPTTGVTAALVKISSVQPTGSTTVTAYADGTTRPATVQLSTPDTAGTFALTVTRVGADGKVALYVGGSGSTQLTAEVVGYYLATDVSWAARTFAVRGNATLVGVACPSAISCVAVGNSATGPFTETLSGASWTYATLPTVAGATSNVVGGISCPAVGYCVAVGSATNPALWAATLSAGHWTAAALPTPGGSSGSDVEPTSVSCASTAGCTVVGGYANSVSETVLGFSETRTGGVWKQDNDGQLASVNFVNSVSCSTPGACVAVGKNLDFGDGTSRAEVGRLAAGKWTVSLLPTPPIAPADDTFLFGGSSEADGVSCAAAGCAVVGRYDGTDDKSHPLTDTLVSGAWKLASVSNPTSTTALNLTGVSCAGAANCRAISANQTVGALTGPVWTTSSLPLILNSHYQLNATSCPSATACVAVGSVTTGSTTGPYVYRLG